jgi:hypothetical protein
MATDAGILLLSGEAAEDLSDDQYRIMIKDATTGKIRRPDHATNDAPNMAGVLQNAPRSGEAASLMLIGKSKIQLGGTVARGKWIKYEYQSATDAGKGIDASGALDVAIGWLWEGGDEDELGEIVLSGARHQVNAAS